MRGTLQAFLVSAGLLFTGTVSRLEEGRDLGGLFQGFFRGAARFDFVASETSFSFSGRASALETGLASAVSWEVDVRTGEVDLGGMLHGFFAGGANLKSFWRTGGSIITESIDLEFLRMAMGHVGSTICGVEGGTTTTGGTGATTMGGTGAGLGGMFQGFLRGAASLAAMLSAEGVPSDFPSCC